MKIGERVKAGAIFDLENIVEFMTKTRQRSIEITPRNHQLTPLYEVIKNGTKRLVIAHGTSAGKTPLAAWIKACLDEKLGRKTKALILAPTQAIKTAWTNPHSKDISDEINKYYRCIGLEGNQVVCPILKRADLKNLNENSDIGLINYGKFSYFKDKEKEKQNLDPFEDNVYRQAILELCSNFDIIFLDECHNLKNIFSNTTRAFKEIIERTKDKYCILLSASAVPNKLRDAGFLLYALDPKKYHHYAEIPFDYNLDRNAIRDMQLSNKWFTFTRDDIKQIFGLPDLIEEQPLKIQMSGRSIDEYFSIWKKVGWAGNKINPLRRIASIATVVSKEFEELVYDRWQKKHQLNIFTFLKKGIIRPLEELCSKIYGTEKVGIIHGKISPDQRVKLAEEYRKGILQVLINTAQTMGEGIPLITYDRPATVLLAEPAISPGEYDQIIGRNYRIDQTAPVHVLESIAESELLYSLMSEEIEKLEEKYGVKFKKSWIPSTTHDDRYWIKNKKQEIFDQFVLKGCELDEIMVAVANASNGEDKKVSENVKAYRSIPIIKKKPEWFGPEINKAGGLIGKEYENSKEQESFKGMVNDYNRPIEELIKYSPGETNTLISGLINILNEKKGDIFKIADFGSGSAVLPRVVQYNKNYEDEKTYLIVDGDERQLRNGMKWCKKEFPKGKLEKIRFIQSNLRNVTEIENSELDVVVCSYTLQYNNQTTRRDIEDIIREINRVLRKDCYAIFALVNQGTKKKEFNALCSLIADYGFNLLKREKINGYTINPKTNRTIKTTPHGLCYLILSQKVKDFYDNYATDNPPIIYTSIKLVPTGGVKRLLFSAREEKKKVKDKKVAKLFYTENGEDIYSLLKNVI